MTEHELDKATGTPYGGWVVHCACGHRIPVGTPWDTTMEEFQALALAAIRNHVLEED